MLDVFSLVLKNVSVFVFNLKCDKNVRRSTIFDLTYAVFLQFNKTSNFLYKKIFSISHGLTGSTLDISVS